MQSYYIFLLKTVCFCGYRTFEEKSRLKQNFSDNCEKSICRLFHILAQTPFTASARELDYCHQKVNTRVVSRVVNLWICLQHFVALTEKLLLPTGIKTTSLLAKICLRSSWITDASHYTRPH